MNSSIITSHDGHIRQLASDVVAQASGNALEISEVAGVMTLKQDVANVVVATVSSATYDDAVRAADGVLAVLARRGRSEQMWSLVANAVKFDEELIDRVMRRVVGPVMAYRDATIERAESVGVTSVQQHSVGR